MRVTIKRKTSSYPVLVGTGALKRLPAFLRSTYPGREAILVSETGLKSGPAARTLRVLAAGGVRARAFYLPSGEAAKTLAQVRRLWEFLAASGAERRTPVVAVGGGSVGDAAGFAASAFYRGLPLLQVPTTLLAMADSAVGGKTAVNLGPAGRLGPAKNVIGAFHQPELVVCDTDFLKSLPKREFFSGMAEVVKYALVYDPVFADWLSRRWEDVLAGRRGARERVVRTSVAWKAKAVGEDERDRSGRREILNFGHTFGHALEAASGLRTFRHGEAVAWGMRCAVALSEAKGWLPAAQARRAKALLARLPAVRPPRQASPARLMSLMKFDKKAATGRNVFILLRGLGRPARTTRVSRSEVLRAMKEAS